MGPLVRAAGSTLWGAARLWQVLLRPAGGRSAALTPQMVIGCGAVGAQSVAGRGWPGLLASVLQPLAWAQSA